MPENRKYPISVLVPVKNEEVNIAACLESVRWADEIFVVDSKSSDRTAAIAETMGATVIQFEYNGRWPKKKNWALEQLPFRNEWVFIIDADERVTPELADEIGSMIQNPEMAGYYINRKFIFLGRWIKHCGWYPNWNLRLFKHKLGRYEFLGEGTADLRTGDNEVHEHVLLRGKAGYSQHHLMHDDYRDLYHWIERHNRYSSWESAVYSNLREKQNDTIGQSLIGEPLQRRRFFKRIWVHLPFKPTLKFIAMYVLKLGFLDGKAGYYFCRLHSHHEFNIKAKRYELRLREDQSTSNEGNLNAIEDAVRPGS
jgi:glycosyltransferase involved in cell wall biosynthesis